MSELFLRLSENEQAQILRSLSTKLDIKRDAILLEKDIWICWALEFLFKMPGQLPMAFKGGTSLSKAFNIINRFSEDIDITIDYRTLDCEDPFIDGISKNKIKNISDQLRLKITQYIKDTIIPYFEKIISEEFDKNAPIVKLDNDGETLHFFYPTVIKESREYITDSIRLEFGGRNIVTPNISQTITADISKYLSELIFPTAEVTVLSPKKTFWEKITLIHYECNRPTLREDANRISRHWYDVSKLFETDIGKDALTNFQLLNEVIKIKKTFYDSSFANYDDCLNRKICLTPSNNYLKLLEEDFNKMLINNMFYEEPPKFHDILKNIKLIESQINQEIQ